MKESARQRRSSSLWESIDRSGVASGGVQRRTNARAVSRPFCLDTMSSIDAAADTRGVANEAEDEPLTVCEEAVRRMSFDSQDKEALAGGDRKPPIVRAQRAKPGTSALSTMLEAVSPKSDMDKSEEDGAFAFKRADKESSGAKAEPIARGMASKSASLASFLPSSSLSPPRVHKFTSALIEERPSPGEEVEIQESTSAPDDRISFAEFGAVENPTPQSIPPPKYGDQGIIGEKHVLVMVGLPARGKTHMAKRLCQYLRFFHGANTRVFNVGEYRRRFAGAGQKADYFKRENKEQRMRFAREALKDLVDFLFKEDSMSFLEQRGVDSGRVAIFDATNSTRERRRWLVDQIGSLPLKVLFIESICTDKSVIERNVRSVKISNRDYEGLMTPEQAFQDFMQRMKNYEDEYQPMGDEEETDLSFIKLIDCGRRVEINRVHGYLLGRVAQFLSNMHATTCSIYLSRHGQSEYNSHGKIGGDSVLTPMGEAYALKLAEFAEHVITKDAETGEDTPARLWTSSLQRTKLTARHLKHDKIRASSGKDWIQMAPRVLRNLDEIYAGVCDGMTYDEIRTAYPREYELRRQNKLSYRYPRGESYLDVIARLDPLIQELESYREDVLIVGHQGVLRLIYAYFAGLNRDEAATLSIPLNTVMKLTPRTHDCIEERFLLHDPNENNEPLDPPSN